MSIIVRRDKTLAGYNGNIESVFVVDAGKDYDNGTLVTIGGLADTAKFGREVKEAKLATADTGSEEVLMVITPELMYDEKKTLDQFTNPEEGVARAYRFADGDVVSLTVSGLPSGVAVGDLLVAGAEGKLVAYESGAYKVAFEVIEDCGYELTSKEKAFALAIHRDYGEVATP